MTISPCNSQNCPYIVKQRSTVGNLLTFLFLQAVIFLLATLALRAVGRADVQTQAFVQKFTKNQPLAD
ncbi:hypothetical protein MHD_03780 [Mannheimia granulomatis]|uniref:Uncharacterized protein n=1 Tax=Mannheimia granulomatis TaxID=85402 RepID=A0A011MLA8_9PAST|nr:hypothetical protein [Mannheimia granulomatis]EXI63296.1 hypothetical protein AK33_02355 [Mannheimia granulomatis]RGE49077.1 hypothetical protein MHD_03780 [Mannheimia granulomatis]